MYKVLGVLQVGGTLVLAFHFLFGWFQPVTALYAALYFLGKGLLFGFTKNPLSFADAICGFVLLMSLLGWWSAGWATAIVLVFLLQKGVTYLLR